MDLPMKDSPEVGWVIAPDFHRQGFGREALCAALAWSDRTLQCDSWCMIDPSNVPSKMLAGSVGFRSHSTVEYQAHPMEVFVRECPTLTTHRAG
jgi:RimJ/RimL family protein N-acetyltransferase